MHKEPQGFQDLIVIHGDSRLKLWLMCNWFNIKSLSNVKFEIKSQTLKMFQLHKTWKIL
jgi:hypothetical protein